jgi:CPA2 family monovalent cation:H+ antiporter-2
MREAPYVIAAGIQRAVVVILTDAGMRGSEEVIRLAREVNSKVRVFARTAYLREIEVLRQASADTVFSSEGEMALTMTEFILRRLGATEVQIDREWDRIDTELFRVLLSVKPLIEGEERISTELTGETMLPIAGAEVPP